MQKIPLNQIDAKILAVVGNISEKRAREILATNPSDIESLKAATEKIARSRIPNDFRKLSLNRISANDLKHLGLSVGAARKFIENGPYFFLEDALNSAGFINHDVRQRLSICLQQPVLRLEDGRKLFPQKGMLVVRLNDSESDIIRKKISTLHIHLSHREYASGAYLKIRVPEIEGAFSKLQKFSGLDLVVPTFRDWEGVERLIDPRYVILQLKVGVSLDDPRKFINTFGLQIEEQINESHIWILQLPAPADLDELERALRILSTQDWCKIAEPAYLPDSDLEQVDNDSEKYFESAAIPWNLRLMGLPEGWSRGRGNSAIELAVIDTGIDSDHPVLAGNIVERAAPEDWDFVDDESLEPEDDLGHGTAVASIIVGNGRAGVYGVAPDCKVIPLRIPVSGSLGAYARRRAALLYAARRASTSRVIVNCSWKTTGDVGIIRDAIDDLHAAGAIIIASAGNYPEVRDQPHYPSDYPSVISVGAVGSNSKRASYSFFGSKIDIAAPGGDGSSGQNQIAVANPGGVIVRDYGTSFAAPHVAAAAALIWAASPEFSAGEVRARLEQSARNIEDIGLGSGLVDIRQAIHSHDFLSDLSGDPALDWVNEASVAELVNITEMPVFSARLIVARQPFTNWIQIGATTGVTELHVKLLKEHVYNNSTPFFPTSSKAPCSNEIVNVNSATLEEFMAIGLPKFSATLLIERRPIRSEKQLDNLIGMTPEVRQWIVLL
jgi:hypothetical protein